MNTDVVMKANSHGIRIILNEDNSMEQILSDIREKLYSQEVFLKKSGRVPVTFEGRLLSSGEEEQILYELNHLPNTEVEFCLEASKQDLCSQIDIPPHRAKNPPEKKQVKKNVQKKLSDKQFSTIEKKALPPDIFKNDTIQFFCGNLRKGQTLEVKKSIIILGNIEKKATIISNGNVIVLGKLSGNVIAGQDHLKNRFVLALQMEPVHIKIGSAVYNKTKQNRKQFHTDDAMMASCENGQLLFQALSQTSL